MTQICRWGATGDVFGDQPECTVARAAVVEIMERYAAERGIARVPSIVLGNRWLVTGLRSTD